MKQREDNPWQDSVRRTVPFVPALPSTRYRSSVSKVIYELAARIQAGERQLSTAECDYLCDVVVHPDVYDWRARRAAAWTLGRAHLEVEQREHAGGALSWAVRGVDYDRLGPPMGRGLLIAFPFALYIFILMRPSGFGDIVALLMVWMAAGFLVWIPYLPIALDRERRLNDRAIAQFVATLSEMGMAETVPSLLDGLRFGQGSRTREAVDRCLPAVLESIRAEHYGQIPRLTTSLCDAFGKVGIESKRAVLGALTRAGDGRAADRLKRYWHSSSIEVQGWIDDALVVLWERQKHERNSARLLRPADPVEADGLLRPVAGGVTPPDELLRPAANE